MQLGGQTVAIIWRLIPSGGVQMQVLTTLDEWRHYAQTVLDELILERMQLRLIRGSKFESANSQGLYEVCTLDQ